MEKYLQQCVHWSALAWKCGKSEGGIFIPMDDHIEQFCLSENCYNCPQLQTQDKAQPHSINWENRRKNKRIYTQKPLTLSTAALPYFEPEFQQQQEIFHTEKLPAKTLDISAGGMRLLADAPLSEHSFIEFSFDKSFAKQLKRAKGKVQWCNKQIDEPGYQMGIAFAESQTSKAIGRYLQENLAA